MTLHIRYSLDDRKTEPESDISIAVSLW